MIKLSIEAMSQMDRIDRYLNKNWLDEDFPTDKIYDVLLQFQKQELEATNPQEGGN